MSGDTASRKEEVDRDPRIAEWEFPGWGQASRIDDLGDAPNAITHLDSTHQNKLGEWAATAICGNDITSSCLYVAALAGLHGGRFAPLCLLLVAAVLYLFRRIYGEVISALPLNGGAYNVLLNTTTKYWASMAACLTLLSYVATAVISATEAMHYAHNFWEGMSVQGATFVVLAFFALLSIVGIGESAAVAMVIFTVHLVTLAVLVLASGARVAADATILSANLRSPLGPPALPSAGVATAIFFGFSAGLLGISGFESSSNFVEEQKRGVFPKTLRNMWLAVAILNPLISLASLGVVPLGELAAHQNDLLAYMAAVSGGSLLGHWVALDAVLVLCGAVLTAYVGVSGLMLRMSLDRCLPEFLLTTNRWRGTNHWIVVAFFLTCCSILVITNGDVQRLGGVYAISFLAVMALFGIGNVLLKVKRAGLRRDERASGVVVTLAVAAVLLGMWGQIHLDPVNFQVFLAYFSVTAGLVTIMFVRIQLLKVLLFGINSVSNYVVSTAESFRQRVRDVINRITSQPVVYFTKGDELSLLNRAALYVLSNEQTRRLIIVHVSRHDDLIPPELAQHIAFIDQEYPPLRIDFLVVLGDFGPPLIEQLSHVLKVPKNYMFIGTPGDHFPHELEELGGVRLIM